MIEATVGTAYISAALCHLSLLNTSCRFMSTRSVCFDRRLSLTRVMAQSCSSITTPFRAFIMGGMSSRVRMRGCEGERDVDRKPSAAVESLIWTF